jgi:hypothetical protein
MSRLINPKKIDFFAELEALNFDNLDGARKPW